MKTNFDIIRVVNTYKISNILVLHATFNIQAYLDHNLNTGGASIKYEIRRVVLQIQLIFTTISCRQKFKKYPISEPLFH